MLLWIHRLRVSTGRSSGRAFDDGGGVGCRGWTAVVIIVVIVIVSVVDGVNESG